jgi:hypothetical protein
MSTNDHTVPKMYLRRFARHTRGDGYYIVAAEVDHPSTSFETNIRNVGATKNFYWGTDIDGVPHHHMETLLGKIETGAAKAFSLVLDDPEYALPQQWPLPHDDRLKMSWWIAAQLLRTTRQRHRIEHLATIGSTVPAPATVTAAAASNRHIAFIVERLASLAAAIHLRPWGLAYSTTCLHTSDVPVVILNGHDDGRQIRAASYWDVVLPLDPHRLLMLPGINAQMEDADKQQDHRILFGGEGLILLDIVRDAADRYLFHHPSHPPRRVPARNDPRLPTPWTGDTRSAGPEYVIQYEALAPSLTVERRWVHEHPPHRAS